MTNEHGVVIDDGVCARLAEQQQQLVGRFKVA